MRKKGIRMIGFIVLLCFLVLASYSIFMYRSVSKTATQIHEPLERISEKPLMVEKKVFRPVSILLLGIDQEQNTRGRSDTMIVITVNPQTNTTKMLSIPRDTKVNIVGREKSDKINHAFAFGGANMAVKTVEQFLGIPIDYYVQVNMDGFKQVIEQLDGITVFNPTAFSIEGTNFSQGTVTLRGDQALQFVRMRKDDPKGDFGRQERQRKVIEAIAKKGSEPQVLAKLPAILSVIGESTKTNFTLEQMKEFHDGYKQAKENIETIEMTGQGIRQNRIYYFIVQEPERQRISTLLKQHLAQKSP